MADQWTQALPRDLVEVIRRRDRHRRLMTGVTDVSHGAHLSFHRDLAFSGSEAAIDLSGIIKDLSNVDLERDILKRAGLDGGRAGNPSGFSGDMSRMSQIARQLQDPRADSIKLLGEAMGIARKYNDSVNWRDVNWLKTPVDKAYRLQKLMRRAPDFANTSIAQARISHALGLMQDDMRHTLHNLKTGGQYGEALGSSLYEGLTADVRSIAEVKDRAAALAARLPNGDGLDLVKEHLGTLADISEAPLFEKRLGNLQADVASLFAARTDHRVEVRSALLSNQAIEQSQVGMYRAAMTEAVLPSSPLVRMGLQVKRGDDLITLSRTAPIRAAHAADEGKSAYAIRRSRMRELKREMRSMMEPGDKFAGYTFRSLDPNASVSVDGERLRFTNNRRILTDLGIDLTLSPAERKQALEAQWASVQNTTLPGVVQFKKLASGQPILGSGTTLTRAILDQAGSGDDGRLTKEIIDQNSAIRTKMEGYFDLSLKRLTDNKMLSDEDRKVMTQLYGMLGITSSDPAEIRKQLRQKLLPEMLSTQKSKETAEALTLFRRFLPGFTRQQNLDVAAQDAMNTAFISKVHQPKEWIANSLSGSTMMQENLKVDIVEAVRRKRIASTPSDLRADLNPVELKEQAELIFDRLNKARAKGRGVLDQAIADVGIAEYISSGQAARNATWQNAIERKLPVFVPKIGEVRPLRTIENVIDDSKGISKMMVEVRRLSTNPARVSVSANAEQWSKLLTATTTGKGVGPDVFKTLGLMSFPDAPGHNAAVVREASSGVKRLVMPESLGSMINWNEMRSTKTAMNTLIKAWTPWLMEEDTREEAFNSMYVATREVLGDKMLDKTRTDEFGQIINNNYRAVQRRFFELMEPVMGNGDADMRIVDRAISSLRKAGTTIDFTTDLDKATVHELWTKARNVNAEIRRMSMTDFQRSFRMLQSFKYNNLSLDAARFDEDGSSTMLSTIKGSESPEDIVIGMEENTERVSLRKKAWDAYKTMTKEEGLTPGEALTGLRSNLGYGADEISHVMKRSPKARAALAEMLESRNWMMQSTTNIQTLMQAAQSSGVDLRFQVHADTSASSAVVSTGRARMTRAGVVDIGGQTFIPENEQDLHTFTLFTDSVNGEIRERHGFVGASSRVAGLAENELPIANLPNFERNILSGRAWREGTDPDATFLNLRSVARGHRSSLMIDTEYFSVDGAPNQLLQIAYQNPFDAGMNGEIPIRPTQELSRLVRARLGLYEQLHNEFDFVSPEDAAKSLMAKGSDPALIAQRERDIMNAMRFVGLLSPDERTRELFEGSFQYDRIGNRRTASGIRDFQTMKSGVLSAMEHLEQNGMDEAEALRVFMTDAKKRILIGQNISNADITQLAAAAERHGMKAPTNPLIELETMARYLHPEGVNGKASWSMENLIKLLPGDDPVRTEYESGAHKAAVDVRAQSGVFTHLMGEMEQRGIDPANIEAVERGSYFVTNTENDLGLKPGIHQLDSHSNARGQYTINFRRAGADGELDTVVDPVTRSSRAEIIGLMQQHGDTVATLEQAQTRMENLQWQRSNEIIGDTFNSGLYRIERLLDAGSGGERAQKTATVLLNLPATNAQTRADLAAGRFPSGSSVASQWLHLAHDEIAGYGEQQITDNARQAGQALLGSQGFSALQESFMDVEAVNRGASHLNLTAEEFRGQRMDLLSHVNEAIKRRAESKKLDGIFRLPDMMVDDTAIPMTLDMANPERSMWSNVQRASESYRLPLEQDRKRMATRDIHEMLAGQGIVSGLPEGSHSPSVDVMGAQAARYVSQNGTPMETPDLVGYVGRLTHDPEEAASLRGELQGIVGQHPLTQMVEGDAAARAQRSQFRAAIGVMPGRGMRIPLPLYKNLPLSGEDASGLLADAEGNALTPHELVGSIEARTEELRNNRMAQRQTRIAAQRSRLSDSPEALRMTALEAEENSLRTGLSQDLSLARAHIDNPDLARLTGVSSPGPDTMIMYGPTSIAGRRIRDLDYGSLVAAPGELANYMEHDSQLGQTVANTVRNINEQIKDKAAGRFEARVGDLLDLPAAAPAAPNVAKEAIVRGSAQAEAAEVAETAMTAARQAIETSAGGSAATEEAEYISKKLLGGISKYASPKYVLPALAGAAILGAITLGDHPLPRPAHNEAPAPDGQYDDSDMAERPLPPDITMGQQAYVEPNGTGMTVRLRTRSAHSGSQIASVVQGALGSTNGQMSVTVRDNTSKLDHGWLQDQIRGLL